MWIYWWGGEREVSEGLRGLYPASPLSSSLHSIPALREAVCGCVALCLLPLSVLARVVLPFFFLFFIFFSRAGYSIGGILLAETRRAVLQVSQL